MLKNLCVRTKLFVLLLIPVGVLITDMVGSALDNYREMDAMNAAAHIVALSVAGNDTIHELQKERGISVGYTSSKGASFAADLREQRRATVAAHRALAEQIASFVAEQPSSALNSSFRGMLQRLDNLDRLRSSIDAFNVPVKDVIAEYTGTIKELRHILDEILQYSESAAMYAKTANFLELVAAKEFAGQERAQLSGALAAGAFSAGGYRAWVERIVLQNEYLAPALAAATPEVKALSARDVVPLRDVVEGFRQRTFAGLEQNRFEDDPKAWFAASTKYIDALREVEKSMSNELESLAQEMASTAQQVFFTKAAVAVGVLSATVLLAWLIVRDIVGSLRLSVNFAQRVAANELDAEIVMERKDEFGVLAHALTAMLDSIKEMIGRADAATESAREETEKATFAMSEAQEARSQAERATRDGMVAAADRIHTAVEALSLLVQGISGQLEQSDSGAREQSGRLASTATAMEEMNATVMEVARNCSSASEIAGKAREEARKGAEKVLDVSAHIAGVLKDVESLKETMTRLGGRVQNVDTVLNVISDIADQTNLLALNAAIEAARAGEAGRGFAVVADEVRKLAEKTMTATKEVEEVLSGIQQDTESNIRTVDATLGGMHTTTELAQESGNALQAIVELSDSTRGQIESIATAATEQSATSEEINNNVESVSRIATDTADAMSRSINDMRGLMEQAGALERLVAELRAE